MRPPHITRDYFRSRRESRDFARRFNEAPAYYEGLHGDALEFVAVSQLQ